MKRFKTRAAQGEISVRRLSAWTPPADATPLPASGGRVIVGHSETGHHHTVDGDAVDVYESAIVPAGMRILHAIVKAPASLDHHRRFDTHESLALQPGCYEIRIGREYDPYSEIARQQAD